MKNKLLEKQKFVILIISFIILLLVSFVISVCVGSQKISLSELINIFSIKKSTNVLLFFS